MKRVTFGLLPFYYLLCLLTLSSCAEDTRKNGANGMVFEKINQETPLQEDSQIPEDTTAQENDKPAHTIQTKINTDK